MAVYGVDVLAPDVTLRRVKLLTERLPPGSWPDMAHPHSWDVQAYLLAQLIDEVAALHYSFVRANGGKPTRPRPFPRPKQVPAVAQPRQQQRTGWGAFADALMDQSGVQVHHA